MKKFLMTMVVVTQFCGAAYGQVDSANGVGR
jgi:hypothetical protein